MSNNHLVSKTYLKWFQDDISKKPYCSFYQAIKGKLQWTSPKPKDIQQICYEKERFSTQTEDKFNDLFEGKWNKLIEHLNQFDFAKLQKSHYKKNCILNGEQISLILNFIFVHYKRTKQIKNKNRNDPSVIKNLREYEQKLGRKLSHQEIDGFHKKIDNSFAVAPQESTKLLKKRPWLLCINRNATPFITSSTPVIWFDEIKHGIYSPLSPKFAIFISLAKNKEKTGIIIEGINESNVKKFNELMKEILIKKNDEQRILISNKKNALNILIDLKRDKSDIACTKT